jgi:hypothetical protein
MKTAFTLLLIAAFGLSGFGQDRPLTQSEYVALLYGLDKDFSGKDGIVEALRRRGIEFSVTDGLRSLTRTKGRNDQELRRALEEAERRRQDPTAARPPSAKEAADILAKARKNTLEAVEEMPDFVVRQQIQRSMAFAGTGSFRNLDRLVVGVSYRASGHEEYKVLSINGAIQDNPESKRSYEEVGGTSSTGEFVTVLATIFKPENETVFDVVDTDTIRGRRAVMFNFSVEADKAKQYITCKGILTDSTVTGVKGRIWIDLELKRVLRVETEATGIPPSFPCPSARRDIDYDWTTISDERFLLPLVSDVRLTFRDRDRMFESRNLIRFRDYQKYGTDVIAVDDDEVVVENKPQ